MCIKYKGFTQTNIFNPSFAKIKRLIFVKPATASLSISKMFIK